MDAWQSPFPFVHAAGLERASKRLSEGPFDVLLLDLGLGEATTLSLLRYASECEPLVPVVLLDPPDERFPATDLTLAEAGAIATLDLATTTGETLERTLIFAAQVGRRLARLHELAHRDALTGLHNRRGLERRIDHASEDGSGALVSLLFVDVDGFKRVNDLLGHANGDLLLQTLAARLRGVVRGDVTIARVGGDEFAVLLEGITSGAVAELVARRVVEAFRRPISVAGQKVMLSASVGIAFGRTGDGSIHAMLREADDAMYEAKGLSGGCYVLGATLCIARH